MLLTRLKRNLCRKHLHTYIFSGSLLLFLTVALINVITECNINNINETPNRVCMASYYMTLILTASGEKNCTRIIRGDDNEIRKALLNNLIVKNRKVCASPKEYLDATKDCKAFRKKRKYIEFSLSKEEVDFPIAYSMVIHDNVEMFERLLRAIYAPHNIYCIHMDKKSPESFQEAVRAITSCFHNVFVASKLENVVYASWSRVQADLNCMKNLLQSKVEWKYLINTCGTDFPLKTNAEIVSTLKSLNGKNSMESESPPSFKKRRWGYHYVVKPDTNYIARTDIKKEPPPVPVPIFSGSAYIVVTVEFVKALFENPIAKQFIQWAKDTYSPDEYLWATLNRVAVMPGYLPAHLKYDISDINAIARLVKWQSLEGELKNGAPYKQCTGTHRREVCIYGTGDLNWMLQQHHLFANKFDPHVDDNVIQCLEEYLRYKAFHPLVDLF
ncbi:hypothetical protein GDO86_006224 [Hymenochirus boettgeri]|uniref:Beta-1,3-galactosyl-O-glycosyl-glycoprotein beta-1,6-N-acetylglucosaminyltransferase 3-like n=1 Tax=Hymenochirus boettgeri TaxID=247094 RepID=A0A8T2JD57_9PIPI|nr:hypothetical protein GDO86_006224 [Hymenochirus boettgeri]